MALKAKKVCLIIGFAFVICLAFTLKNRPSSPLMTNQDTRRTVSRDKAKHGSNATSSNYLINNTDGSKCPDILTGMTKGRWLTRPLTDFEQMSIDAYLQSERSHFNIPPTFQRQDGKCGDNITYEKTPLYKHMWFKSICNPKGATPCCKDYRCVDLPVEKCRCSTCYDERQVIYPEFSTWLPDDRRCKPTTFSKNEACRLLKGVTIHVVGDSFVREVYIALAILLSGKNVDGALKKDLFMEVRNKCLGMFQVTGADCRHAIYEAGQLCGGTVKISYTEAWNAENVKLIQAELMGLRRTRRSFMLLGLGIHDNFNMTILKKQFFEPLFHTRKVLALIVSRGVQQMSSNTSTNTSQSTFNSKPAQQKSLSSENPKLFWMGVHSPGLLKSSHWQAQSAEGVQKFNKIVGKMLDKEGIPHLETFDFTSGVLSFDGTHYGFAINMLKVNMFLTYVRETFKEV